MPITIQLPTDLPPPRHLQCNGTTVQEALQNLQLLRPELVPQYLNATSAPQPFVKVFLNEDDIQYLRGGDTTIHDGDTIVILSSMKSAT
jgi:molybdopterin converting factor small subunit